MIHTIPRTGTPIVRAGVTPRPVILMLVIALATTITAIPVAADNAGADSGCILNGDGDVILCVYAYANVYTDGHGDGYCKTTDASSSGDLTCTNSDALNPDTEDCSWEITHTGCTTSRTAHRTTLTETITAFGCVGIEAEVGPFTTTVAGKEVVVIADETSAGNQACLEITATAPDAD